jgi:hypothetical protein
MGDEQANARHDGASGIRVGLFFYSFHCCQLAEISAAKVKKPNKKNLGGRSNLRQNLGQFVPVVGLR